MTKKYRNLFFRAIQCGIQQTMTLNAREMVVAFTIHSAAAAMEFHSLSTMPHVKLVVLMVASFVIFPSVKKLKKRFKIFFFENLKHSQCLLKLTFEILCTKNASRSKENQIKFTFLTLF